MASITNPSHDIAFLSDCITWDFALGGDHKKKRLLYQLWSKDFDGGNDRPISAVRVLQFASDSEIVNPPNFSSNMALALGVTIPSLDQSGASMADPKFKKVFYIKFGEFELGEDCEGNTSSLDQQSGEIMVMNSYFQAYQDESKNDLIILSDKPSCITLCRDSNDWLWVCDNNGYEIIITFNLKDGTTSTTSQSLPNGVSIVHIGPNNVKLGSVNISDVVSYTIDISDPDSQPYTVIVKDCCCKNDKRIDIHFMEPKGTISTLNFECLDSVFVDKTVQEICRMPNCNVSMNDMVQLYGRQVMNTRHWRRLTLKLKNFVFENERAYYDAFSGHSHCFARFLGADDAKKNIPGSFIIENASIPSYEHAKLTEIEITGYYSADFKTHRQGI